MTVELLQKLSLISYIAAGVLCVAAVVLFFVLDIRKVIGDVTGATARKAIDNIRQQNEASGDKAYKPSPVNAARGKLTDKISPSGKLVPQQQGLGGSPGTEKFDTTELTPPTEETTILPTESNETTILCEPASETTLLDQTVGFGSTEILSPPDGEPGAQETASPGQPREASGVRVDVEVGFAESQEIIE